MLLSTWHGVCSCAKSNILCNNLAMTMAKSAK